MIKKLPATLLAIALALPVYAESVSKIASAGGDITEILFEFGVGEKVVAVDSTSIFPETVNDLPSIGYVRELSAEGVLATGADILIGSYDMGPPAVMDNLKAAGLDVVFAPNGQGASRFADKVNIVASVLDMPGRGEELIAAYEAELLTIKTRAAALERSPRVLLVLSVRDGSPIAAGQDTTGNDIIDIAGGQNVATFDGWKPMNSEAIITAAPDIIVMSTLHVERLGGADVIMAREDIAATPAGQNQSYVILSPQLMLQFGPRSPEAMNDLISAFETVSQG